MSDTSDYITVTRGMSGWHALHVSWVDGEGYGPHQTGVGRYETQAEAVQEAVEWGRAVDLPVRYVASPPSHGGAHGTAPAPPASHARETGGETVRG